MENVNAWNELLSTLNFDYEKELQLTTTSHINII